MLSTARHLSIPFSSLGVGLGQGSKLTSSSCAESIFLRPEKTNPCQGDEYPTCVLVHSFDSARQNADMTQQTCNMRAPDPSQDGLGS